VLVYVYHSWVCCVFGGEEVVTGYYSPVGKAAI
jgi:hypothetical protein